MTLKLPVLTIMGSLKKAAMEYPRFSLHIPEEDLIESFTLTPDEWYLLSKWRENANTLGFAILMKSFQYLGYPPLQKEDIPGAVISCINRQLDLDIGLFDQYRWKDSVWKVHLNSIREFTGFSPISKSESEKISLWLIDHRQSHPSRAKMYAAAICRYRHLRRELPKEKEFQRLVNSAWQQYLNKVCHEISGRVSSEIRTMMDQSLEFDPNDKERYGWIKANPRKIGLKTLMIENVFCGIAPTSSKWITWT